MVRRSERDGWLRYLITGDAARIRLLTFESEGLKKNIDSGANCWQNVVCELEFRNGRMGFRLGKWAADTFAFQA